MIHLCYEGGGQLTRCCQVLVIELPPEDRMTADESLVTCRDLLKEAVAALMVAGREINDEGRCQGPLWALYDCLFSILEHLGAEGLPQKESEGGERG